MNVLIDTNIWISALMSKDGQSRDIIRLALNDKISPQISTSLFLEYETVMKRNKIQNDLFKLFYQLANGMRSFIFGDQTLETKMMIF